tara:strand:+ start:1250 stop:1714 length:465 start_codon:yes stop_codon:yes gene_type:complete
MSTTFTCDFCKSTKTVKDNEWAFGNNGQIDGVFLSDGTLLRLGMLPPKFEDGGDVCDTCNKEYVIPLRIASNTYIKEAEKIAKNDKKRADEYKSNFINNIRELLSWTYENRWEHFKDNSKPKEAPKLTEILDQFRFDIPVSEEIPEMLGKIKKK